MIDNHHHHHHHHHHLLRSFNLIAPQYLGLPTCKETQKWQQLLVRKKIVKISDDFEKVSGLFRPFADLVLKVAVIALIVFLACQSLNELGLDSERSIYRVIAMLTDCPIGYISGT